LPPDGILPRAKFTLRQSLAFSYIGTVTAWHSSSGRQPKFAAWYKEWNYRTFTEGATYIRLDGHHGWASAHILVMAAVCNRAGHYIFCCYIWTPFGLFDVSLTRIV